MRRTPLFVSLLGFVIGCSGDARRDDAAAADTVSQATRDSAVARSGLPGARAVGRAQDAAGAAQERAARLDSLQQ